MGFLGVSSLHFWYNGGIVQHMKSHGMNGAPWRDRRSAGKELPMDCDVAYYEFYNVEQNGPVTFTSDTGHTHECYYYIYTPIDGEIDESTPVVVYVTHGGGTADEERAIALGWAAGFETRAIIISPSSDRPDAVCAVLEDAKRRLSGCGDFDAVSAHGTSSGGRAVIRAALKSVDPTAGYSFRFSNVFAYDPARESADASITDQTEWMRLLAQQGVVLFFQTDTDTNARHGGSGWLCNQYAETYSNVGGTAIVAEISSGDHEAKFIKPLSHNSMNWAIGRGMLKEDEHYQNSWYYYQDGVKYACSLADADRLLNPVRLRRAAANVSSSVLKIK